MSDWKKEGLKKRKYRRGGVEPEPPKMRHKSRKKPFKLEYSCAGDGRLDSLFRRWLRNRPEWLHQGRYVKLDDAIKAAKDQVHKGFHEKWRIIDTRTKEVVWDNNPPVE